jgi:flavin reductase (DIM6/NTAB) family NADH-FMN oxidoreductase RutF
LPTFGAVRGVDEASRKKTLRMIPYALYVVGVRRKEVRDVATDVNAFVASWVTQVSFKPPMLALAVRRDAHSLAMIEESGVFTLNVLGHEQKDLATRFFKELAVTPTELSGVAYRRGLWTGAPVIPETPAHVECEVAHVYAGENDHAVVVAKVVAWEHRFDARPLTHAETGWHYAG